MYIHPVDLDYHPSSSTNAHIRVIPAEDLQNKYGNDCLVFDKKGVKTFPIVCHQGWWYELYRDRQTNRGFLGPFRSEVHATDIEVTPRDGSADEQEQDETDDNDEPETALRHTSVAIDPTGPGSPHREGQKPWAPLITPTRPYSTFTPTITTQQMSMGSTTAAVTTTSTRAGPPALAAAPTAPTAPAAAPAAPPLGGAAQPRVDERLRNALATAL